MYSPSSHLAAGAALDGRKKEALTQAYNRFITSCSLQNHSVTDVKELLGTLFGIVFDKRDALTTVDNDLTPPMETNPHVFNQLLEQGLKVPHIIGVLDRVTKLCLGGVLDALANDGKGLTGALKHMVSFRHQETGVPLAHELSLLMGTSHLHGLRASERLKKLLAHAQARVNEASKGLQGEPLALASYVDGALATIGKHEKAVDMLGSAIKTEQENAKKLYAAVNGISDPAQRKAVLAATHDFVGITATVTLLMQQASLLRSKVDSTRKYLEEMVGSVVAVGAVAAKPTAAPAPAGGRFASAGGRTDRMARAALGGGTAAIRLCGGRSGKTGRAMAADALSVGMLAGDVRMLALLDALNVDLSQQERMVVSNAYANCVQSGVHGHTFREEVYRKLGGRGLRALVAVHLLDPEDLPAGHGSSDGDGDDRDDVDGSSMDGRSADGSSMDGSSVDGSSVDGRSADGSSVASEGGRSFGSGGGDEDEGEDDASGVEDYSDGDDGSSMGGRYYDGGEALRRAAALAVPY